MKGELDFAEFVIIIEGIFHFVAVIVRVVVSNNLGRINKNLVFAEDFGDEFGFELILIVPVDNLPGRSRKITSVFWLHTKLGWVTDFGSNSLNKM